MQRMGAQILDQAGFVRALEAKREMNGLTRRQLARRLGISASTLTRLTQGRRPDVDTFVRLLAWLDMPASAFTTGAAKAESSDNRDALSAISRALSRDSSLRPEDSVALQRIMRITYSQFARSTRKEKK